MELELAGKNTRGHLPVIAVKLAAFIENQGEKSSTLLSIFSDLLTNNIKETKCWNNDTKSLFAGCPGLWWTGIIENNSKNIGGRSLLIW